MIYDEQNIKEDTTKIILTQEFDINGITVIEIPVKKGNMDTPGTQGYAVIYVIAALEKCSPAIQYMEYHNQDFNQKRFLDVKYIFLNHRSNALQWYESIQAHGETW